MATINDLVLPNGAILVLPDDGSATSGTIVRTSPMGGGHFIVSFGGIGGIETEYTNVLFVKEMATEVTIDGVEYLAMHQSALLAIEKLVRLTTFCRSVRIPRINSTLPEHNI